MVRAAAAETPSAWSISLRDARWLGGGYLDLDEEDLVDCLRCLAKLGEAPADQPVDLETSGNQPLLGHHGRMTITSASSLLIL